MKMEKFDIVNAEVAEIAPRGASTRQNLLVLGVAMILIMLPYLYFRLLVHVARSYQSWLVRAARAVGEETLKARLMR